jgi:hypothetical protein
VRANFVYPHAVPVARRTLTVLALAALLLSGCGLVPHNRRPEPPRFGFLYQADSGAGYMNQTLAIENFSTRSYAPFPAPVRG